MRKKTFLESRLIKLMIDDNDNNNKYTLIYIYIYICMYIYHHHLTTFTFFIFIIIITNRYLREYQSLGTAGGIYHFRDEIQRDRPEHVFVLNADVACAFPLTEMMKFHNTHRGLCTILG